MIRAAASGIAVAIHAIGDRAVRVALDAIAPTRITHPALRQRVEHIQLVAGRYRPRFGTLGVIASMQPIHATSDRDLVDRYWGPKRGAAGVPWRHSSDGRHLAFGSDAPVEPIDPLLGSTPRWPATPRGSDRWYPAERSPSTRRSRLLVRRGVLDGREKERGTLEVGMRCDATVVERDLAKVEEKEIPRGQGHPHDHRWVVRYANGLA